ncbi:MAG TPA: IclR family transcriptional regulator [Candidatus Limnocylindrales bacterium]|nr:IclR family transcriptional regulator [Candidatus Limnocylindrales bacterium]
MSRVQSIERAFAVLAALTDGPVGVTEVAERVDLPKSTAARMLASLAREGAVEQVPGETRYRLGPRIETLATGLPGSSTRNLIAIARPHLAELAAALGEAAGLSIPDGREVHYIDQVDSPTPNPVGIRDWTGSRVPMHAVSSGLVILAHRPAAVVDRALAGPLVALTEHTVTDPAAIRERLRPVALAGYAWVHDEFATGISSVAAGVADTTGEVVAAIHVHGPSYRFPPAGREAALGLIVATTAGRIGRALRQAAG